MGKEIEYKMVDLGLPSGLKWADRNVGAVNIQDYGDYFMWGSTEPDTDNVCDWAHAPFNNGSEKFDEAYFNEHKSEWLTDGGILKPEYDAASVNMGDGWRMPTLDEFRELIDGTCLHKEVLNGVERVCFTSKTNGNVIFIPFCGHRYGSVFYDSENFLYLWTSSLEPDYNSTSYGIEFCFRSGLLTDNYRRLDGFAVRGVHE